MRIENESVVENLGNKRITFVINDIHRRNGGNASILDLAGACQRLGVEVYLLIRKGTLAKFEYFALVFFGLRARETIIRWQHILGLPRRFERLRYTRSVTPKLSSWIRYLLEEFCSFTFDRGKKVDDILKGTDIVIAAAKLSGKGWYQLRQKTNAKIVFNHAGSPDTFREFWVSEDSLCVDPAYSGLSSYIRRMMSFDCLLFQSLAHAERARDLGMPKSIDLTVLEPSCDEDALITAKQLESPFKGKRNIVVIGSIQARKNQALALDVVQKLQDEYDCRVNLHFVGAIRDQLYGQRLKEQAKKSDMAESIFFWGFRRDYLRFLVHSDLMLILSRGEGLPRIMREAAGFGKIVAGVYSEGYDVFYPTLWSRCFSQTSSADDVALLVHELLLSGNMKADAQAEMIKAYEERFSQQAYCESVHVCLQKWLKLQ